MSRTVTLEDFSGARLVAASAGFAPHAFAADESSAAPSESYEEGYRAGYEDAAQSALKDQTRIRTELAHNLQDVGFTFHEARAQVMRSLEPLLRELTDRLLPEMLRETLAQQIIEAAMPMAQAAADAPVEVVIAPANRAALEPVLSSIAHMNFVVKDEPSLGEGQVYLQSGISEMSLDFTGALEDLRAAMAALMDINKEAVRHG